MHKYKDFVIIAAGHATQAVILVLSTRLMTMLLTAQELGRFAIIYAVTALFVALFISSPGVYAQRRLLEWNRERTVGVLSRRYIYYFLMAALCISFFLTVFKQVVGLAVHISGVWIFGLVFGLLFFTHARSFYANALNIFQKRLWYILCLNLTLIFSLLGSLWLVVAFDRVAEFWILGQVLGQAVVFILAGILFSRVIRRPAEGKPVAIPSSSGLIRDVVHFAWPLSVASLILWGHGQAYQFLTNSLFGLEVVGFFVVGYNLGTKLMEKVDSLFLSFLDPFFYQEIAHGNRQQRTTAWNRYARAFIPAIFLLAAFIGTGRHFLAKLFLAKDFQAISADTMLWGTLTALITIVRAVYTKVGISELKMTDLLGPYLMGTGVTLTGIVSGAGKADPYVVIGSSLLGGAAVMLVYLMIKMHRLLPVSFPVGRLGAAALAIVPMAVFFHLADSWLIKASLVQAIAVIGLGGIYLLAVEFLFAREWMAVRPSETRTH